MVRHEAELIKEIGEEVLTIVKPKCLEVAQHPIGLESHINCIVCLLNDDGESDVGRIIGIYGLGGIGKTTIAKAVFNVMFRNFEGSVFLANVREGSKQKGLAFLQEQLLSGVFMREEERTIYNEDEGINIIKGRLSCKRLLIVLDNVEKMNQFYKLIGGYNCFGSGSRIILTTRNEHLLDSLDVDEKHKYRVEAMNQNESLQLFTLHAFRQNHPSEDYLKLSNEVIRYAGGGGLPLVLVVLGSLLYNRNKVLWERELKNLRKIPNNQIFDILEISYNALHEDDRTIFLDISCFFIGWKKKYVITIVDACDLGGEAGIEILKEMSLVTFDKFNLLHMHDLIRDMGREIVRKQSPRKRGGRSRLWDNADAIDVFINFNVSIISITNWEHYFQEGNFCFRKLLWVNWNGFPFEFIPNYFHLGKLVILHMPESNLKEVWKGTKHLTKLKELDLSGSPYLTRAPHFSGLPNLEKLILDQCGSLVEVHESIGCLTKLVNLNLSYCDNLKNLPKGISKLASRETLDISLCLKFEKLPEGIRNLKSLTVLCVSYIAIEDLPHDFWTLSQLQTLIVSNCRRLKSIPMLPSSLCSLCAAGSSELIRLPNLSNLKHLTMLNLHECEKRTDIRGLEGLKSVETILLRWCANLKRFFKKKFFQTWTVDPVSTSHELDGPIDILVLKRTKTFKLPSEEVSLSFDFFFKEASKFNGKQLYIVDFFKPVARGDAVVKRAGEIVSGGALGHSRPVGTKSYARAVGGTLPAIDELPDPIKTGNSTKVVIPQEAYKKELLGFKTALVGRTNFRFITLDGIRAASRSSWRLEVGEVLSPLGKGFFLSRFEKEEDMAAIWKRGTVRVGSQTITFQRWKQRFTVNDRSKSSKLVWIRFPDLLLEYWNEKLLLSPRRQGDRWRLTVAHNG
ncbi:TMV resistance protein N-like [Telopea speciosissima]|uniref:TMV resistance protein N-like n=1 Tax=Telopea speciosissima TaxID=54955 RepID=UPI001CC58944|nr:TMV resistance protein N-like [Telopea speciosissima]